MTTRTQIYLSSELHRAARKRAHDMGIALTEYIRRVIARDLGTPAATTDPTAVFALGDSGGSDIARDKDRMIGEAAAAEHQRGRRTPRDAVRR
ncbi:MAG: hypothetical protein L0H83_13695 [Salinisphaera sp.]|nr:hypothetical protein [Salinisphaera sp.]